MLLALDGKVLHFPFIVLLYQSPGDNDADTTYKVETVKDGKILQYKKSGCVTTW
ncbi:MAG: hypothetical protein IPO48_19980 [Saprospiraceae bacterium]|nr:hypothetical protein [Saprospiraceae bacterium]